MADKNTITDKLAVEKLVDNLNMLGKHGTSSMTMIADPKNLSGAF